MPETVESIQLEAFERLVYSHQIEEAAQALMKIIDLIKRGSGFQYYGNMVSTEALVTRLAAAIAAMFADPNFNISFEGFAAMARDHSTLHSIFRASSFRNSDFVLSVIGDRSKDVSCNISFGGDKSGKLLLLWSLESDIAVDFHAVAAESPEWVAVALLGILAIGGVHSIAAYERKKMLMGMANLLESTPPVDAIMLPAGDAYMHCSYMSEPDRHEIKKVLNRQLRKLVLSRLPIKETHQLARKELPTIVVPVEWFGSNHAMYRCYAPSILQLRKRFRVIGIARPNEIDEVGKQVFDKVVEMPAQSVSISDMVNAIYAEQPDIIYYPSIGMASWWVALSNFRLAPIQVMTPGHPATTHSDCIDYIISDGDLFGNESNYREKCVHMPVGGARYIGRAEFDRSKLSKINDGVVRVAIPAMVMKLTPPFLSVLKVISEQASSQVEFHFFPNQQGMSHYLIERDLKEWIPNCVVHPRFEYQQYMETLGRCDIMFSTFPFGGTNSVIDAFLCGLPVLAMEGDQILERSDASMIRRMSIPEWYVCHTVDGYIHKALTFIAERIRVSIKPEDVEREFYGEGPPEVADAFLNAFLSIYEEKLSEQERAVSDGTDESVGVLSAIGGDLIAPELG